MQGYLQLFSQVARIQHELVLENAMADVALPSTDQIAQAQEFLMPPLAVATWPRDSAWQLAARDLARRLLDANPALPEAARALLQKITDATPAWLEKQASEILNGLDVELDRGAACRERDHQRAPEAPLETNEQRHVAAGEEQRG